MNKIGSENVFLATHSQRELNVVERILRLPTVSKDITLSPESKFDKNSDLTGLMFASECENPIAYPGLVPDNGCGFCLGLIRGIPASFDDWDGLAQALIQSGGVFSSGRRKSAPSDLLKVMLCGLPGSEEHFYFDLNAEVKGTTFYEELQTDAELPILLQQPFGCFLGHFLEIRKPEPCERFAEDEYILIIHSGSQGIHRLLNNKLHEKYHYHSRVYGSSLDTEEGLNRKIAAQMAMNYAKASRLFAFKLIQRCLCQFIGAETAFLSDVFHSYIQYDEGRILHCRGIQNFDCACNDTPHPYYLLAGTQTTSSYLMEPTAAAGSICHGTPEVFYSDPKCAGKNPPDTLLWRDTISKGDAYCFEAVTHDLAMHFEAKGISKPIARLLPVFNMQRADK